MEFELGFGECRESETDHVVCNVANSRHALLPRLVTTCQTVSTSDFEL